MATLPVLAQGTQVRRADIMPKFLQNKIYPTCLPTQVLLSDIHQDLDQTNIARRHFLAPVKMIHAVAVEIIGLIAHSFIALSLIVGQLGRGKFKHSVGHLINGLMYVGNGVLFSASGLLAAPIALIIPSVLKVFKKDKCLSIDINWLDPRDALIQDLKKTIEQKTADVRKVQHDGDTLVDQLDRRIAGYKETIAALEAQIKEEQKATRQAQHEGDVLISKLDEKAIGYKEKIRELEGQVAKHQATISQLSKETAPTAAKKGTKKTKRTAETAIERTSKPQASARVTRSAKKK